ncbi:MULTISPECIES: hypothetical protein [Agathobacter]|uniref:Uncharacterized protein n=1 Tax=Agathobacter ruminis TaxID=1712665 RepID=A0A2G3E5D0_9FIRM|nr:MULTISPECIES: hypothetical protein [Agathobacter]MBQ1682087.1 hypothetical protein [Agathobacter sp.]MCR5677185.1 hypothetical protein [Agathobacter sp.]MDC7302329.1 hypothetical protein [Agathobacter ruminis]PHU38411.1 hypothetical protein CSX02_03030 [Agathobacter ruminis]
MDQIKPRKNPSREACEATIKRILMTEVLEHGSNKTFRFASDFMNYFESLYPPSPGLTKQVQRAVKAMDMPKDEHGYFIVNKTNDQVGQDKEIKRIFSSAHVSVNTMEKAEPLFLHVDENAKDYLFHLLLESETFKGKFLTLFPVSGGIMIYTETRNQLVMLLNSLTI